MPSPLIWFYKFVQSFDMVTIRSIKLLFECTLTYWNDLCIEFNFML